MKKEVSALFRDAERLSPPPELWRRIAERSPLVPDGEAAAPPRSAWREMPYLRAAGVALAAGVAALAAYGLLHGPQSEAARDMSAATLASADAGGAAEVIDPELLGWQADLGVFDSEAEEAGEAL